MIATAQRSTFFAAAQFARGKWVAGDYILQSASEVHAKRMGGIVTICGQSALTWFKYCSLPFADATGMKCVRCESALAANESSTATSRCPGRTLT